VLHGYTIWSTSTTSRCSVVTTSFPRYYQVVKGADCEGKDPKGQVRFPWFILLSRKCSVNQDFQVIITGCKVKHVNNEKHQNKFSFDVEIADSGRSLSLYAQVGFCLLCFPYAVG